ncbi:MAG: hypothetical protein DWQ07_02200 [Chloroflexi bacterium]|nr:MAG: hypothetical protein DWQ07_02200 [Chloroflexota bacterium]MBL1193690.1 hypothetical protein [Chloroflexota bacterium]NOH10982.1 hypothetical protein [Chloroflexota bacterium]
MEKKVLFLAWVNYLSRNALLADYLGASIHFVTYGQRGGNPLLLPLRYIMQSFLTWPILRKEKPDVIVVQVPPLPSAIVAYIYAVFFRARIVIDTHSSTFISFWRRLLWLHRWLSRRALTTIVHNQQIKDIVDEWGCHTTYLGYIPGDYPQGEPYELAQGFNVVATCSFDPDEPILEIVQAAQSVPEVNFYLTGNSSRASEEILASKPDNCQFTGYVSNDAYFGLLRGVDAIMDFTKWENTVLLGAHEAVSLGQPLVVSNSLTLRENFPSGTVHVPNTAEGIAEGVRQMQAEHSRYKKEMLALKEQLQSEFEQQLASLQNRIAEA